MEDKWVALLAALVASLLTGGFSLGITLLSHRRTSRDERLQLRRSAYVGVLHASNVLLALAQALQTLLKTRGSLGDTAGLLLGLRLPLDEADLLREYQDALKRVLDAQDTLTSVGTQQAIDAGEAICIAGAEYLSTCINRSRLQRVFHPIRGWHPTEEQEVAAQAALRRVFEARAELVHVARAESGESPIMLGMEKAADKPEPSPGRP